MDQQDFITRITAALIDEQTLRGLFLGGSYGRGSDDAYSDIDLIAIIDPSHHAALISRWREILQEIAPIVFWSERGQGSVLLNAITEDWLRCDLFIVAEAGFSGRARNTVKPLIDRQGFYDALPASLPAKTPDPAKVQFLIQEFIRVLGLLPVVAGRGEYFTAASGVGMLREHLTNLMLEELPVPDRGGALHLSKLLSPDDTALLASLPFPQPQRDQVIAANFQIARQFFPRARALATKLGIAWPDAFEAATRKKLAAEFGPQHQAGW